MNKLILIIAIVFSGMLMQAQSTSDVAIGFLTPEGCLIDTYLTGLGATYHKHSMKQGETLLSIEIDDVSYLYSLYMKKGAIAKVKVNYKHDNQAHIIELEKVKKEKKYGKIHIGRYSTDVTFKKLK